jgi:serine/threonine-protein kinase SRPK3
MLFQLTDSFRTLSDDELYVALGKPEISPLRQKQELPDSHGPRGVVPSIDPKKFLQAKLLQENVVLTGFGSSFHSTEKRSGHHLEHTITVDYQAPEIMMDDQVTQAIDIWALGCFIFEMRCGWSLFDPTMGGADEVLHRIVYSLGKLPERWWNSWSNHYKYFHAWGAAKKPYGYPSLRSAFGHVGTKDQPTALALSLFEKPGTPITEEELLLLDDLLHKMLRYRPEDRIKMDQVVCHPWFAFQ